MKRGYIIDKYVVIFSQVFMKEIVNTHMMRKLCETRKKERIKKEQEDKRKEEEEERKRRLDPRKSVVAVHFIDFVRNRYSSCTQHFTSLSSFSNKVKR